eukprot:m.43658 g.43658  ORF g.43658 m.43658 type:complete len:60 (+) comp8456_c0_seq1:3555-3734(+)
MRSTLLFGFCSSISFLLLPPSGILLFDLNITQLRSSPNRPSTVRAKLCPTHSPKEINRP